MRAQCLAKLRELRQQIAWKSAVVRLACVQERRNPRAEALEPITRKRRPASSQKRHVLRAVAPRLEHVRGVGLAAATARRVLERKPEARVAGFEIRGERAAHAEALGAVALDGEIRRVLLEPQREINCVLTSEARGLARAQMKLGLKPARKLGFGDRIVKKNFSWARRLGVIDRSDHQQSFSGFLIQSQTDRGPSLHGRGETFSADLERQFLFERRKDLGNQFCDFRFGAKDFAFGGERLALGGAERRQREGAQGVAAAECGAVGENFGDRRIHPAGELETTVRGINQLRAQARGLGADPDGFAIQGRSTQPREQLQKSRHGRLFGEPAAHAGERAVEREVFARGWDRGHGDAAGRDAAHESDERFVQGGFASGMLDGALKVQGPFAPGKAIEEAGDRGGSAFLRGHGFFDLPAFERDDRGGDVGADLVTISAIAITVVVLGPERDFGAHRAVAHHHPKHDFVRSLRVQLNSVGAAQGNPFGPDSREAFPLNSRKIRSH